jgi:hypothetical protein
MLPDVGKLTILSLVLASLVGCGRDPQRGALEASGPEIQIGAGVAHDTMQGGDHEWTAWLYRAQGAGVCLEFRLDMKPGDGVCGGGLGASVTRDARTTFVIGGTQAANARTARILIGDQPAVLVELLLPPAGVTDGVRYYATTLDGGPKVSRVEILDGAGHLLESQAVVDDPGS